jgi:Gpi18-like mannosyltransferase
LKAKAISGLRSGASADARLGRRVTEAPWWLKVIVIFAASRVVTTAIMLIFANMQGVTYWTGPQPDYFAFAGIWDSDWYRIVSIVGYPNQLPLGADGHVAQNAWAFLPGYPAVVRGFLLIGIPFEYASVIVSVAFALGAALLFYRLMARVLPDGTALFAVVLFCTAPLSPILQVGYAESMQLFFLFLALLLFHDRRYYLMIPVIGIAALTRPSGLAFAVMLLLHLVVRFVTRARDPFPWRERIAVIVAGLASAFLGVLWPLVAWIGTGVPSAYTDTELSWRVGYIGYQDLLPFAPWVQGSQWWFTWIHFPAAAIVGPIVLAIVVALFALLLFTPPVRRLGIELRLWLVGYAVYLLAVFFPQSSTFRLFMPFAPALGAVAIPRSPAYRVVLVALGIAGQVGWMAICWYVINPDWSPP